jgi:anti-sigma regulatory factor (Ser/Thr protein kinase)
VPGARLHARHVLREWGFTTNDRARRDHRLLVSELVTNAVKATADALTRRLFARSDGVQHLSSVDQRTFGLQQAGKTVELPEPGSASCSLCAA